MKEKALQAEGVNYLILALCAFAGLGLEAIYIYILEPLIYGSHFSDGGWTTSQLIIHWIITCISWAVITYIIIGVARKKYGFDIFASGEKVKSWQWLSVILLIIISLIVSYISWSGFKVLKEFQNNGGLKFVFQYIYYFFEVALFLLILIFGQKAGEVWFKNENIPYGGILLGLTWGLAHIFTKGSLEVGLLCALAGIMYGAVYLLLGKDIKKAFPIAFIMFVL